MALITGIRRKSKYQNFECRKISPLAEKTWPLCTGCRVFGYCSATCQRNAWSNTEDYLKATGRIESLSAN
ncbi:hypothetical protein BDV98DRAFT_606536 [Pterulicium gracile]|uniref:MYND-type domain-containing protein n=1 Tax=Pterulicium gracile TaxID=1884261 RepID=A0A5C3Q9L5_9AGAR|nr:hypothetical protein BDV98DRAFT_606536 [Pterula gracilis]